MLALQKEEKYLKTKKDSLGEMPVFTTHDVFPQEGAEALASGDSCPH